ncbi:glycosyl hydrolase [Acidipila sp. 4G-K13]|uniref:Glycosyl hydrolase n=1 Tax=Paracidobacterium acidisoli TaxID=2303751 RepID=A0A372IKV0_9BACT|nr:glycosyl hydrolase [Paracidobacterium acidisoli]
MLSGPCLLTAQQAAAPASASPWDAQQSWTTADLRGVDAVGGGVAWASGTNGTVLRTEDAGYMWQACAVPPGAEKLDFRGIKAWDGNTAVVMSSGPGGQSRLYKTTDGCSHWTLLFTNPEKDGFYDALLFVDREHGIVLGDPAHGSPGINPVEGGYFTFRIRVTADGGKIWAPVVDPESGEPGKNLQPLDKEAFFAASNSSMAAQDGWLWLGTSHDRVLRRKYEPWIVPAGLCGGAIDPFSHSCGIPWTDWQSAEVPLASGNATSGLFSIAFRDAQHGIAAGGDYQKPDETAGTAAWTADGGAHWTAAVKPPHGYRSSVAWDAEARAWIAAGPNGSDISHDDGRTWQPLDSTPEGGGWNAISLPWIVGPHGRIARLDPETLKHP